MIRYTFPINTNCANAVKKWLGVGGEKKYQSTQKKGKMIFRHRY